MNGRGLLTVASRVAAVILSLAVLAWVWTQSESPDRPATVKTWVGQLQARQVEDRMTAVQALSNTGAQDENTVIPALVASLDDREASIRSEAALALGHCLEVALKRRGADLTDQARAAISSLLAVLMRDDDLSVRASAAFAAADLLRELRNAGIKPDQSNSDDAIDPRTVAQAFNSALKRDPAARLVILPPYQKLGPFEERAPAVLVAALDDPSRVIRGQALLAVSQFSSGVDQAIPVLLKEAEFKDPLTQPSEYQVNRPVRQAAESLHPTAAVIPILIEGLNSPNADVKSVAAVLLGPPRPGGAIGGASARRRCQGSYSFESRTSETDRAALVF